MPPASWSSTTPGPRPSWGTARWASSSSPSWEATRTESDATGRLAYTASLCWRRSASSDENQPNSALQIAPPNMIATGTTRTITTTMSNAPNTARDITGTTLDVIQASAEHGPGGAGGVPPEGGTT